MVILLLLSERRLLQSARLPGKTADKSNHYDLAGTETGRSAQRFPVAIRRIPSLTTACSTLFP
jgi:hypothetical protein